MCVREIDTFVGACEFRHQLTKGNERVPAAMVFIYMLLHLKQEEEKEKGYVSFISIDLKQRRLMGVYGKANSINSHYTH